MTEFKVGDRVKLKDDFNPHIHGDFVQSMHICIGEIFEIEEIEKIEGVFCVGVLNDGWTFHPDWLELVEREGTAEETEQTESVFLGDTLLQNTVDSIMEYGSLCSSEAFNLGKNEESILQEAQRIVNGERQADYSDPVKNFEHIARIASAILNKEITPEECCIVMIAVKHAREQYKHKRDNLVDLVGYQEILHRIKESKK